MAKSWQDWNTRDWLLHPTMRPTGWREHAKALLTQRDGWQPLARLAFALTLLVLAGLLVGCATPLPPPTEPARNPQPPQLREPLPSESYLQQAQRLIESWRNAVTGM